MSIEKNRRRHSLKIPIPGETQYAFYVWITDEISFVRQDGIGQEIRLSLRNQQGPTTRNVNINEIDIGGSEPVNVEEIKNASHKETQGIGQEALWSFLTAPQNHLKTHDVEIKARKADGAESPTYTLKISKIDQFYVQDSSGIGQEGYWTLDHRDDENQIDFANPDAVYDKNLGPLRLDWFQIVVKPDERYMLILYGTNQIAYFPMSQLDSRNFSATKKTLAYSDWGIDPIRTTQLKFSDTFHATAVNLSFNEDGTIQKSDLQRFYNVKDKLLTGGFATKDIFGGSDYEFAIVMNGAGNTVFTNKGEKIDWSSSGFTSTDLGRDAGVTDLSAISSTGSYYAGGYVGWSNLGRLSGVVGYQGSTGLSSSTSFNPSSAWRLGDGSAAGELVESDSGTNLTPPIDTSTQHDLVPTPSGSGSATAMKYRNDGSLDCVDVFSISMSVSASVLSPIYIRISQQDNETGDRYAYTELHYDNDYAGTISFGSLTFSAGVTAGYYIEEIVNFVVTRYESEPEKGKAYRFQSDFDVFPYWFDTDVQKHNFVLRVEEEDLTNNTSNITWNYYSPYGKLRYPMKGWTHSSNGKHVLQLWEEGNGGDFMHLNLNRTIDIGSAISSEIDADLNSIATIILDVKKSDIDKLK